MTVRGMHDGPRAERAFPDPGLAVQHERAAFLTLGTRDQVADDGALRFAPDQEIFADDRVQVSWTYLRQSSTLIRKAALCAWTVAQATAPADLIVIDVRNEGCSSLRAPSSRLWPRV